jgi:Putative mono-oxygenase ydhR
MATILQFDFPFSGPWGADGAKALKDLADSIAAEPGLVWKAWTENEAEGIAGGIYYFKDEPSALAYKEMHAARLASFGITDIRAKVFDVNEGLSAITRFENA